jgi:hypothetical protein
MVMFASRYFLSTIRELALGVILNIRVSNAE